MRALHPVQVASSDCLIYEHRTSYRLEDELAEIECQFFERPTGEEGLSTVNAQMKPYKNGFAIMPHNPGTGR
jgi:hypothetical protein